MRIPELVRLRIAERHPEGTQRYAERHVAGQDTTLDVRFRGQFCSIDADREPDPLDPNWPAPDWSATRDEHLGRLRATSVPLCRLRCVGDQERWSVTFSPCSHERHELSLVPSGGSWADRLRWR